MISLSVLTAVFPGGPGLAYTRMYPLGFIGAKDDITPPPKKIEIWGTLNFFGADLDQVSTTVSS